MDTEKMVCTCKHRGEQHAIHNAPYNGACMVTGCRCWNFTCPECSETYGLHTSLCKHTPRIPWTTPARR